jgi:uncharacterized membrane protein
MQSVNVLAVNSWFLAAFLGTAALCVVTMVAAAVQLHEPFALFLLLGGLAYLLGCFLVTVVFNVPMNNALAALPVASPDRAARWTAYLANWTTWNHVRTAASLAAAALLTIASQSLALLTRRSAARAVARCRLTRDVLQMPPPRPIFVIIRDAQ